MDIVIFTTSIDGDRRRVAQAVEERLRSAHPELEVESLDLFGRFAPGLSVLGRFAYRQQPGFFPGGRGRFEDLAREEPDHPLVRELERSGLGLIREYLEQARPAAILSVHPAAALAAAQVKYALSASALTGPRPRPQGGSDRAMPAPEAPFCAALIDDWAPTRYWQHPDTDHYFVASEDVRADLVAKGVPWPSVQVIGVPVAAGFEAPPDREDARRQAGLAERFTVLLRHSELAAADIAETGRSLTAAGLQTVMLEPDTGSAAPEERATARGADVAGMLAACEVVIGHAGGIAMAEAVACGLPQILLGQAPAEEAGDVEFLLDHGAALVASDPAAAARKAAFLATHPSRLEEMSANAAGLAFPAAARHVAERMANAARRGPTR